MGNYDFVLLIYSNAFLAIISILFSFLLYFVMFKKDVYSIFDPLTFFLFFSSIGFATVLFLVLIEKIEEYETFHYFTTQFFFIFGVKIINKKGRISEKKISNSEYNFGDKILQTFLVILIFSKLFIFYFEGFTILSESRLSYLFSDNIFVKISNRIYSTLITPTIILIFIYLSIKIKKKHIFYLLILVIITILEGAKSAILNFIMLGFLVSMAMQFNYQKNHLYNYIIKRDIKIFIFTVLLTSLAILLTSSNPFITLFHRISVGGDSFFMTYPNNVLSEIIPPGDKNIFLQLFKGPLNNLNIINTDLKPLGFKIMEYHTGAIGIQKGPIIRHNIMGYAYMNIFQSSIYSLLVGLLLGVSRAKIFKLTSEKPISICLYILLFVLTLRLPSDFYRFFNSILDFLIILVPLTAMIEIIYRRKNALKY